MAMRRSVVVPVPRLVLNTHQMQNGQGYGKQQEQIGRVHEGDGVVGDEGGMKEPRKDAGEKGQKRQKQKHQSQDSQ